MNIGSVPQADGMAAEEIPDDVQALAEAREEARKAKDWKKADAFRAEIEGRGFEVKDTDDGFKLSQK